MGAEKSRCSSNQPISCCSATRAQQYAIDQPMSPLVRQMHLAVMQNDLPKLRETIRLGVDVNYPWINPAQPSVKDGYTPICAAVSLNHIDVAKKLIEAGALVETIDKDGFSPLHKAAYHGRHEIAKLLIEAGADISHSDKDGNSALHMCAKNGFVHNNAKCVQTLLMYGSTVNSMNKKGLIALHYAASWGLQEITAILIEWRSDIDCIDHQYLTPFHHCLIPVMEQKHKKPSSLMRETFQRYLPTIKIFIKAGCDTLGLATWFSAMQSLYAIDDTKFLTWQRQNYPESLKHLCRVYIQQRLGFTNVRHNYCVRKLKKLEIPESLREYLARRLLDP